jgi:hypothetical protein
LEKGGLFRGREAKASPTLNRSLSQLGRLENSGLLGIMSLD